MRRCARSQRRSPPIPPPFTPAPRRSSAGSPTSCGHAERTSPSRAAGPVRAAASSSPSPLPAGCATAAGAASSPRRARCAGSKSRSSRAMHNAARSVRSARRGLGGSAASVTGCDSSPSEPATGRGTSATPASSSRRRGVPAVGGKGPATSPARRNRCARRARRGRSRSVPIAVFRDPHAPSGRRDRSASRATGRRSRGRAPAPAAAPPAASSIRRVRLLRAVPTVPASRVSHAVLAARPRSAPTGESCASRALSPISSQNASARARARSQTSPQPSCQQGTLTVPVTSCVACDRAHSSRRSPPANSPSATRRSTHSRTAVRRTTCASCSSPTGRCLRATRRSWRSSRS